jgi:DMSO/TMAO reductase YedYZ molybdopterin-dependent catalytic subunit
MGLIRTIRSSLGLAGFWAAFATVIVQRLLHGAFRQAPFAPYSAAEWMIRESPGPVATYAIDHLGHNAQPLLGYTFITFSLILGFMIGRRPAWILAAAAFALTLNAAYLDPLAKDTAGALSSAALAGATAFLAQTAFRARTFAKEARDTDAATGGTDWGRRRFLARALLGIIVLGVAGTAALRAGARMAQRAVRADQPALIPTDPAFKEVTGLSPQVTPTAHHYVVDIDLEKPSIGESGWRLAVNGAVKTPLSLSLGELQAMPTKERLNNLSCISNRVGGDLVSNSRWTGVSLDTLLDMAQPHSAAATLVAVSFDGYREGIRLDEIRGKDALVAVGMNGELIPQAHGFPARLLFPDHYGMRNVKWLTVLELKAEDEEGYWAHRGWNREAVVRTESRIDTPKDGGTVQPAFVCAGIAWAGARGIQGVEVSPDGGQTWQAAELESVLGPLSWRRWQLPLNLPAGDYELAVRASDGADQLQDQIKRDPHPSGASGYHRISVTVASA